MGRSLEPLFLLGMRNPRELVVNYGSDEEVPPDHAADAARLVAAMTVTAPASAMTLLGAGYHMAAVAHAIATASGFPDFVDHHANIEEPAMFTHDTVELLARYLDNLADSVRRAPTRLAEHRDPDEVAHWLDRCVKDLRTASATISDSPKRRPLQSD